MTIQSTCSICFEEPATSLLHRVNSIEHRVCRACHDTLVRMGNPRCPICRAPISARVLTAEEINLQNRLADRFCNRLAAGAICVGCVIPAITIGLVTGLTLPYAQEGLNGSFDDLAPYLLIGGAALVGGCISTRLCYLASRLVPEQNPVHTRPPEDLEMGARTL